MIKIITLREKANNIDEIEVELMKYPIKKPLTSDYPSLEYSKVRKPLLDLTVYEIGNLYLVLEISTPIKVIGKKIQDIIEIFQRGHNYFGVLVISNVKYRFMVMEK